MFRLAAVLLSAVLLAQYVDDRNLFEVLQDDLETAMVHSRLSPDQRRLLAQSRLSLVKAAAKQRARKPFDKAEIKQALKEVGRLEEAQVFAAGDRKIVADDVKALELGLEGKIVIDAPRRAPGSVY